VRLKQVALDGFDVGRFDFNPTRVRLKPVVYVGVR